jgi:hypothetical protein
MFSTRKSGDYISYEDNEDKVRVLTCARSLIDDLIKGIKNKKHEYVIAKVWLLYAAVMNLKDNKLEDAMFFLEAYGYEYEYDQYTSEFPRQYENYDKKKLLSVLEEIRTGYKIMNEKNRDKVAEERWKRMNSFGDLMSNIARCCVCTELSKSLYYYTDDPCPHCNTSTKDRKLALISNIRETIKEIDKELDRLECGLEKSEHNFEMIDICVRTDGIELLRDTLRDYKEEEGTENDRS